ncbi:histone-lysine N-methyltransferase setd3 [Drosophila serrata]|uniref:histone-lysine N-methyltransferase setd3 n=1 Tax=Drosophila serrata TaxID=7274 RepID=UPI000A1D2D29|nr:histone-lysine N-methyltransferase setd3 [Drosophila serrata]
MGKNSKRNNKAKQQQAQQARAASGGGGAASSSSTTTNNNNNSSSNNKNEEQNALQRRIPRTNGKQRKELNQLVLQLLDLVQVQPANPNDEWTQYVQLQKLLERITQLEEPLQKAVCQEIAAGDDQQRLAKVQAFSEWAKAAGVRSDGVEIAIFPGYQLGLRATRDLAADEQVLSVPRKLIFSEEHLPESDRRLFCNYPLLTNFNLAYALVIEKVRGTDSEWHPYIDLLPAKYNTVLYFSVAQMQRLRGTAAGAVALRQCRVIARQYANMYKCAHIRSEASSNDGGGSMGVLFTQHGLCYELYR